MKPQKSAQSYVLRQGTAKTLWVFYYFMYSLIMAKFFEILTHFPQVMVSEASATNYDA